MNGAKQDTPEIDQAIVAEQTKNLGIYLHQIFTTVIRGACATIPMRPEMIMVTACRIFANVIARHYGGDEAAVKAFREVCHAEFAAGIHEVQIQPIAKPDAPQEKAA